ncbi:MAG: hypothetical protein Fur0042_07970 [Cyanophyceae cyanobacterium]
MVAQINGAAMAFPAVYSTLSTEALVREILPQYALGEVQACYFWHRGLSDVYWVKAGDRAYMFRVSHHHWRSRDDVYFELEFLDFLRGQDLPIAYPIRSRDGRLGVDIQAPEGPRYGALFIFAPGEVAVGDLDVHRAHQLGGILAAIHRASQDFSSPCQRQPLTPELLVEQAVETIVPFLKERPDCRRTFEGLAADAVAALRSLDRHGDTWVVCWGDPHSGNVHFTAEGHPTLFDFDQCGHGWRAFDLAKFYETAVRTGLSRTIRETFLEGYQAIAPLQPWELNALQPMAQVAHLWAWWIATDSARRHDYSRLDDSFFSRRLSQLRRLASRDWALF